MIRCALQHHGRSAHPLLCAAHPRWNGRLLVSSYWICGYATNGLNGNPPRTSRYRVFERLDRPTGKDVGDWLKLLDLGLPHHLRRSETRDNKDVLNADEIADLLLAAQHTTQPATGIDLLFHLGIEEGRWNAVVWLVKSLVDKFSAAVLSPSRVPETLCSWEDSRSLKDITSAAISLPPASHTAKAVSAVSGKCQSLESIIDDWKPEKYNDKALLQRNAIGQIWRSLGNMTIACADDAIKPEVLEIIAFLHHKELMPMSIYSVKPSTDVTVIQQPPTLHLFSSRILTSLSDAAWRAHEKFIREEAKAKGGEYTSLRPEIPGMAYRVNVAGLRPEIWLELILWSTLHGGWILEGASILRTMCKESGPRTWKPYSWRSLVPGYDHDKQDWDTLEFMFNLRPPSPKERAAAANVSIRRTVSSEVVNAYVDSLLSTMRFGVGGRGVAPGLVLEHMRMLKNFLRRAQMTLNSSSWDAVIVRYLDIRQTVVNHPYKAMELADLSPVIGEELSTRARHDLPSYIRDGSASVIGLLHQSLRSRIHHGDIEGALRVFQAIQTRIDRNKLDSLVDFLQRRRAEPQNAKSADDGLFTSNFAGIEHPAFDARAPASILGPFLDLLMDNKAYEFGKWLLFSEEIDGPLVPESMYRDPIMMPSLIRFATETRDQALLAKIFSVPTVDGQRQQHSLSVQMLQNFLDGQINLGSWDAAIRLLEHIRERDNASWNIYNLAYIARAMLLQISDAQTGNDQSRQGLARVSEIFEGMIKGHYGSLEQRSPYLQRKISMLLTILASVNASWADFCTSLHRLEPHLHFDILSGKTFDILLQGIVAAYGSAQGRYALGLFWSHDVRNAQKASAMFSRYMPNPLDEVGRQRRVIRLPGQSGQQIVVYGGLQPNLMTIRVILGKALEEYADAVRTRPTETNKATNNLSTTPPPHTIHDAEVKPQTIVGTDELEGLDTSPYGMVVWSIRRLRDLKMSDDDIKDQLRTGLLKGEMSDFDAEFETQADGCRVEDPENSATA